MYIYTKLLHCLYLIKRKDKRDPYGGICAYVWNYALNWTDREEMEETLKDMFSLWPKFSGDIVYPVPPEENSILTPEEAFLFNVQNGSIWTGEYGKLRLELLEFLIEESTKRLETCVGENTNDD